MTEPTPVASCGISACQKPYEKTFTGPSNTYSEGPKAFPEPMDRPARAIITAEGRRAPSRFKHVVQTDGRFHRIHHGCGWLPLFASLTQHGVNFPTTCGQ